MKNNFPKIRIDDFELFQMLQKSIRTGLFYSNYCCSDQLVAKLLVDDLIKKEQQTDLLMKSDQIMLLISNKCWSIFTSDRLKELVEHKN